ncbi:MAG: TlpA family protein disulfide reductase [Candidatus Dormibacteraeota bacterium]|nr:TlpA family protein disulfide reductase [Candidatus Dormibacteraeota bacterium]
MALAALVVLCGCSLQHPLEAANQSQATVGQPAPDFTGSDLDGKSISLRDFRGHPVLLNFWASWCGPCRAEQPGLNAIREEYQAKGLRIVGVTVRDNLNQARIYRQEFHVEYPSLFDQAARLGYAYQVDAPPSSVLIDAGGVVRYKETGGVGADVLRRLLADKLKLT